LSEIVGSVLVLFGLFQVKHMLADYFMQTPRMLSGRSEYWHMGRAQHAFVHAIGSGLVFLVVGTPLVLLAAICLAEWVVHFNIDWAKARFTDDKNLSPAEPRFWQAFGVDQTLHGLTYVAMVWLWVVCAA